MFVCSFPRENPGRMINHVHARSPRSISIELGANPDLKEYFMPCPLIQINLRLQDVAKKFREP